MRCSKMLMAIINQKGDVLVKEGRKNSGRICTWLLAAAIFAVIGAGMSFWYTGAHAEVTLQTA